MKRIEVLTLRRLHAISPSCLQAFLCTFDSCSKISGPFTREFAQTATDHSIAEELGECSLQELKGREVSDTAHSPFHEAESAQRDATYHTPGVPAADEGLQR